MVSVGAILKRYGVVPKKSLGQSFLRDPQVAEVIVALAGIKEDETVVEIGAGIGFMTRMIAASARKVIALEIDPSLVGILKAELKCEPRIEVIETNVLKYDFNDIIAGTPQEKIKVIGNIPYNISSPILFHLLNFRAGISSLTLMVQKEVADRLVAPPGNKTYGIPTVIISMYADISQRLIVSPQCFFPRPKVQSCVLNLRFLADSRVKLGDHEFFRDMVKISFAGRRKTLFNNLRLGRIRGLSASKISDILAQIGIDGRRRAETLTVEEFGILSNAFLEHV